MSRLKLFREPAPAPHGLRIFSDDQPVIYSFQAFVKKRPGQNFSPSQKPQSAPQNRLTRRARALKENTQCPACSRSQVKPLDLADGLMGRNHRPIPGTSTLVGFHCTQCNWEWPAEC